MPKFLFLGKIYDQQAPGQLRHFCDGTFVFAFIRQRLLLTRLKFTDCLHRLVYSLISMFYRKLLNAQSAGTFENSIANSACSPIEIKCPRIERHLFPLCLISWI